ncbi:MAG: DNA polymerase IV, partial [Oscillospiraceae bacterium]
MDPVILHCDLNCFYASVELLSHPDLRDVPMAVCGDPDARHGIILAKNEPAKQLGIVTAETIWQAKKKCPNLVLLPPHHDLYQHYSRKVNAIYEQYSDLVEPFGIDESWLDITGSMHLFGGDAKQIADGLRARLREELGLTLSIGVSFNKIFAKLGSDYQKPDATTVISRENWRDLVFPLPVGDLLFVGKAARQVLGQYGVTTIGQLAACPPEMLETLLGKLGLQLRAYANGEDRSPVRRAGDHEPLKSVGNSSTFRKDLTRWDEVKTGVAVLADSVAMRLRRHGLCAGGVQIAIRSADFKTISRQKQLPHSTHLMRELEAAALELIAAAWHAP